MTAKEYNECVHELADGLYRFAYLNIHQQEDAQDVVQQSFEILWKEKKTIPKEKAKSFLYTIAYRRCMDKHRHRKREQAYDITHNETVITLEYSDYEWKEYLQKALSQLDDTSRSLILLKDLEGYKYEEIAVLTELTVTQVKVYLHRARKKVKQFLSPVLKPQEND